eukprot:scaffold143642_cov32-Tisochrysis_lutea.AAC.4
MGNSGKNSNTSQFFITLGDVSRLTGKHVGFGKLLDGEQVHPGSLRHYSPFKHSVKPRARNHVTDSSPWAPTQVLSIMEQCAAAENDDSGKPTHPVRIADCGVCGVYEPAPMAWVRHPE